MKIVLLLPLLTSGLLLYTPLEAKSVAQIEEQITQARGQINRIQTQEGTLETRVKRLSDEISQAQKRLITIDSDLAKTQRDITDLERKVEAERESYEKLQTERDKLLVKRDEIEKRLVDLLAKHISQSLVFSGSEPAQEADLIREQLFYAVKERSGKEISLLQEDFVRHQKDLDRVQGRIAAMSQRHDQLAQTQQRQAALQAEQHSTLRELDRQKRRYLADLNEVIEQKNRQRQMLADLNVVRQQAVDAMHQARLSAEQAQRQERLTAEQRRAQQIEVRQLGSSYQAASRSSYRGQRVKPPLDDRYHITLIKDYGPYTDPIYNIRIHNDSVTLKANEDEAVVRSVLAGKVIYAEDLKLLGKVVILEHPGNLHTIYRNLEEIAPHVRVGQNIRARQSIGRVNQELVFEVTKDGLPINPMQLITLR